MTTKPLLIMLKKLALKNVPSREEESDLPEKSDYQEWPLFKEFRTTLEFLTVYEEVFGEKFVVESTEESKVSFHILPKKDSPQLPGVALEHINEPESEM